MGELKKSCTTTTPVTPETAAAAVKSALDGLIEMLRPDIPSLNTAGPLKELREKLAPFFDFLRVKAMRFFGLASYPLQYNFGFVTCTFLCLSFMHLWVIMYYQCVTIHNQVGDAIIVEASHFWSYLIRNLNLNYARFNRNHSSVFTRIFFKSFMQHLNLIISDLFKKKHWIP